MKKPAITTINDGAYKGVAPLRQPNDLKVAPDLSLKRSLQRSINMGIIRRQKSDNYSVIYNECFQNPALSARAKGIFAYLMTLPDDWKIYKQELGKHFKEGRDAINTAFDELEKAGYITKTPERGKQGRLDGWDYTVYESTELLETRNTVNPSDGESATTKYLSLPSTNSTNSSQAPAEEDASQEQNKSNKKPKTSPAIDIVALMAAYAETGLPRVAKLTDARKRTLCARVKEYSYDEVLEVFSRAKESKFLQGSTGWTAKFDWLINPNNFCKVIEGNYDNEGPSVADAEAKILKECNL